MSLQEWIRKILSALMGPKPVPVPVEARPRPAQEPGASRDWRRAHARL